MTTSPAGRNPQFARVQRTLLNSRPARCSRRPLRGECANFVPAGCDRDLPRALTCIARLATSSFSGMTGSFTEGIADAASDLAAAVQAYRLDDNLGTLLDRLRLLASRVTPDALTAAAEPYRDLPEVVIPVYEHVVAVSPTDARSMVILANAYWLTGRGPEVVGELASRAAAADPANRAAWHLWALAASNVRVRVARWQQVCERFPSDQLARAALADNAASLAGAEHDPLALDLAIATYEGLLGEATDPSQRSALGTAIKMLKGWRL
jgi:hypothetical protein